MSPEELLALEKKVINGVLGTWKDDVGAVKETVLTLIAQSDGKLGLGDVDTILALLNRLEVPKDMESLALEGVLAAHQFGVGLFMEGADLETPPNVAVSNNSQRAVGSLTMDAQSALDTTRRQLMAPGVIDSSTALLTAMAPLLQNPAKMERSVAWSINNASNSAVSKAALKSGEEMTWISERDGCVSCLAYSGKRSTLTGFPTGLTFGKKPVEASGGTLPHPPLHPGCRCTVEVGISDDYAEALERESVRSILRGFKLPSESEKVRIDAAKALLSKDPVAPESVKKYAARRVKAYEEKQNK